MTEELSPSQAAARIGATTRSVQRWIASGRLPARRVGGRWRVASDVLDAFAPGIDAVPLDAPGVAAASGVAAARGVVGPAGRSRPFGVLFVANRGEIARRIARTAGALGVATVVPPTTGPDAVDLLDAEAVVAAARAGGAEALHPGYGFLAESPDLADAVVAAGLTWVGPPPAAIRALGDKAQARAIARSVGVPVAAGEEPADQSDGSLAAAAARIGYPVLLKPAAGGGGKGIRVVADPAALMEALAAARREAARAFGDARLLVERYIPRARHVEVQVVADGHGALAHLGDRDCSLQRRHQKLLEEAPAPGLEPGLRAALHGAALRLATAVAYRNAGTCEFLVAEDGSFVFLEMNARLQVEHPVTELVVGCDLVAAQLWIAAGARLAELGLDQAWIDDALERGGHAVEVRLNAEDPAAGFLPSAGRVVAVAWPAGAGRFGPTGPTGLRVDAGVETGDEVGGRFDPLLAKVIAHGATRDDALDRLGGGLAATEVLGLATNLRFLRRLLTEPTVRSAALRTDTLEGDPADSPVAAALDPPEIPERAWALAARALADEGPGDPWWGGWRANQPGRLWLEADPGEGRGRHCVELPMTAPFPASAQAPEPLPLVVDGAVAHVSIDGRSVAFRLASPPDLALAEVGLGRPDAEPTGRLTAPMPGTVLAVHAAEGDHVEAGARVVTLEAMKMEHVVVAPRGGRIEALHVREGDQVERGRLIALLGETP